MYGERGLPAMGFDPWSYDSINKGRGVSVNEWFRGLAAADGSLTSADSVLDPTWDEHSGYRQPLLNRVYSTTELSELRVPIPAKPERIRWPVNLEDLNWYLYELPSTGYRDPLWLYWVSSDGRRRVVNSAYGENAVPFPRDGDLGNLSSVDSMVVPDCFLPGREG